MNHQAAKAQGIKLASIFLKADDDGDMVSAKTGWKSLASHDPIE